LGLGADIYIGDQAGGTVNVTMNGSTGYFQKKWKEVGHACSFRQIMNREQIVGVDGSRRNQGTDYTVAKAMVHKSAICEERQQVSGAIFALGPDLDRPHL